MTMKFIASTELATSNSQIVFSSIPQTYTDLMLTWSMRGESASTLMSITINGSTANITQVRVLANGATVTVSNTSGYEFEAARTGSTYTTSAFSTGQIYIPNYRDTFMTKPFSIESAAPNASSTETKFMFASGLWNSTAAINSIAINVAFGASNFSQFSRVTLYGITKG